MRKGLDFLNTSDLRINPKRTGFGTGPRNSIVLKSHWLKAGGSLKKKNTAEDTSFAHWF
jgi:hypothetical protein